MQPMAPLPSLWLACGLDRQQGGLGGLARRFSNLCAPWRPTALMLAVLLAVAEVADTALPHAACAWVVEASWSPGWSTYCRAIADNGSHALVSLAVWQAADPTWLLSVGPRVRGLPRSRPQESRTRWLLERAAALLSGSMVDLDHFLAARSNQLVR
jgi:hypothetical protein